MRLHSILLAALSTIAFATFCADDAPQPCTSCGMSVTVQRAHQTAQVSEVENSFIASNITIAAGDTVTWTNNGMEHHTTTSDQGLWDSGEMVPGKSFSHTFKSAGVFPYSCTYHKTMGMKGKVNVLPPPPVITSPLSATGAAGLPFYYAIAATDSPNTFSAAPLPQGLVLNGNTITGIPAAAGSFSVTIGASSASGGDSKTLALEIIAAIPEADGDGDGFPDALETLSGSSPGDMSSTPFGIPSGTLAPLTISKLALSLNFVKPASDSFKLTGSFGVASQPVLSGSIMVLDFGGVVKLFTLEANGSAKSGNDALKFTVKPATISGLLTAFSIRSRKGSFAQTLALIGLDGSADAKAVPKAISVMLLFNGTAYQKTQIVSYTSKLNKSGMAK